MKGFQLVEGPFLQGRLIARRKRFITDVEIDGQRVEAYLANPGRMFNIMLPGARVVLKPVDGSNRRLKYDLVSVVMDQGVVVANSSMLNRVAERAIAGGLIPAFRDCRVVRTEMPFKNHRFDLLLECGDGPRVLEVKSSTQTVGECSMFPDAPTLRGRSHLQALTDPDLPGRGAVLFLLSGPRPRCFMPDFHTDPEFARTFLAVMDRVDMTACRVDVTPDMWIQGIEQVPVVTDGISLDDSGTYAVLFRVPSDVEIQAGALGKQHFAAGWYVYVGKAGKGLGARVARHRTRRKRLRWHVDYLSSRFPGVWSYVIRGRDCECGLATALRGIGAFWVPGFGASDCKCPSHLIFFRGDPRLNPGFVRVLEGFRAGRL